MSVPTTASRSIDIAAPPEVVYDLVSDITRTGEWIGRDWLRVNRARARI